MTPVMDAMAGIAYDLETAVLAIHHLAKPSAERRGDVWDRFRGASSIRSGTDANLALDGTGNRVKLVGEFRDSEPLLEHLELDRKSLLFQAGRAARGANEGRSGRTANLRGAAAAGHRPPSRRSVQRGASHRAQGAPQPRMR